jgi:hypothetical protein
MNTKSTKIAAPLTAFSIALACLSGCDQTTGSFAQNQSQSVPAQTVIHKNDSYYGREAQTSAAALGAIVEPLVVPEQQQNFNENMQQIQGACTLLDLLARE